MAPTAASLLRWERAHFRITTRGGHKEVHGIVSTPFGLHFRESHGIDVTHLPSGRRMHPDGFRSLGAAMEFVEQVTPLANWHREAPIIGSDVVLVRQVEAIYKAVTERTT